LGPIPNPQSPIPNPQSPKVLLSYFPLKNNFIFFCSFFIEYFIITDLI
jgi:hypothetical protein